MHYKFEKEEDKIYVFIKKNLFKFPFHYEIQCISINWLANCYMARNCVYAIDMLLWATISPMQKII